MEEFRFSLHTQITAFWGSFIIAAVLSIPILKLLYRLKSRQTVSQHAPEGHQQKQGTPTMGGLIIIAGVLGGGLLTGDLTGSHFPLYLLFVLFAVIGFVDDYVVPKLMPGTRGLGWKQKILMQLVAATFSMILLTNGSVKQFDSIALGVFAILFFSNAFNFVDGLDGLAGGVLLAMLFGLVGVQNALLITNGPLLMSQIIAGATLPFLFWNAPKARVFMGDVGSLAIGSFLGASFFAGTRSSTPMAIPPYGYLALFLWSFVMIAELVPVPLQIASVKLRKKKLFPYTPIHHAFEKAGWPETRVVFMFVIVQVCCSVAAQQLGQLQQLETMVAVSNR